MGCDIHMFVQYRDKKDAERNKEQGRPPYWWDYGNGINPGRNYAMFGILAGVRGRSENFFEDKGIPDFGLGWSARDSLYLNIDDDPIPGENCCTLESAKRWGNKIYYHEDGRPWYTEHPDWHSHSWMTIKELEQAYRWYKKETGDTPCLEYRVLLKTMKALEDKGKNEVVVVFWFDN